MGKGSRREFPPDSSPVIAHVSSGLSNSQLLGYRAAVDDLVEASRCRGPSDLLAAERLVAGRLGQPEFAAVLSRLDGGVDAAAARLMREIRNYRPSVRSSASDLPTFVRILLLSQIDSVWWSGTAPFVSDTDVLRSTELVDLAPLRSAKMLQFQYRAQSAGLPGRARDWAQRQALPGSPSSVRPDCASPVRGRRSSPWSTRSLASSPRRSRREPRASG